MLNKALGTLLSHLNIQPVLIDVGASGAPPKIWRSIARSSIYVGFDPDLRELREITNGQFRKSTIVNEAVSSEGQDGDVPFFFTRSPYCSSMLMPDTASLDHFLFSDLFVVEREGVVRATSLNAVLDRLGLAAIDWLKVDTQGLDMRIFNSLRSDVRAHVLALDIEPGLIDAYIGEDLFVDNHRELTRAGFWLSNLDVRGTVRMRRSALREVMATERGLSYQSVQKSVKKSPGWCEARYLRTTEWLAECGAPRRDYVLLWIFALLDGQLGFAIDVAAEHERSFGYDEVARVMKAIPIARLKRSRPLMYFAYVLELGALALRRLGQS